MSKYNNDYQYCFSGIAMGKIVKQLIFKSHFSFKNNNNNNSRKLDFVTLKHKSLNKISHCFISCKIFR